MHALTVVKTYLRLGLLNVMQYRADFFMQIVSILVTLGSALLTIGIVFGQTNEIGGWTEPDLIALIGVQMLVRGFTSLVMRPSMERLMENIRMGTLDFMLTKPADSQLLASVAQVNVAASADILGGAIVLGLALARLGSAVGVGEALLFVVMLFCGVVMIYAFLLATSTIAFWFVRVDNLLVIFNTMFNGAGGWPITIFPAWLKFSLTFMVPVAFAVTVPAQSLTGRLTIGYALGAIGLAVFFAVGSRWFWRFGLKHYTGASA